MNRKSIISLAVMATLVTGTAFAAHGDTDVTPLALNGVKHATRADGSLKPNAAGHRQIRNGAISCQKLNADLRHKVCAGLTGMNGANGVSGANGANGAQGNVGKEGAPGVQGANGLQGNRGDGTIVVNDETPGVCLTNPSVHLTADGVVFGPYTSNEEGGSVCVDPGDGVHLRDIAHLAYTASFNASTDNGDAPYLRVFLNGDTSDLIYSPSTQPGACYGPAPIAGAGSQCASRGRMILYTVENGTVRYNDDPGSAPDVTWAEVLNAHGADVVDAIYVTSGFALPTTTGAVLNSLSFEIAGQLPTTLAFAS